MKSTQLAADACAAPSSTSSSSSPSGSTVAVVQQLQQNLSVAQPQIKDLQVSHSVLPSSFFHRPFIRLSLCLLISWFFFPVGSCLMGFNFVFFSSVVLRLNPQTFSNSFNKSSSMYNSKRRRSSPSIFKVRNCRHNCRMHNSRRPISQPLPLPFRPLLLLHNFNNKFNR